MREYLVSIVICRLGWIYGLRVSGPDYRGGVNGAGRVDVRLLQQLALLLIV